MSSRIYCTGTPEDYVQVHGLQEKFCALPLSYCCKHHTPVPSPVDNGKGSSLSYAVKPLIGRNRMPLRKTPQRQFWPSIVRIWVDTWKVGFNRTQDEYGGDWAMAQFILATETDNEEERNARMTEILKYNEEDLAATWAVFKWLRDKAAKVTTN